MAELTMVSTMVSSEGGSGITGRKNTIHSDEKGMDGCFKTQNRFKALQQN
jgi:hypothetical protein